MKIQAKWHIHKRSCRSTRFIPISKGNWHLFLRITSRANLCAEPSQSLYLLSCTVLAVCHGIILIKQILITTWHSVTNAPAGFTGNVPKFQMKSLRNKQAGFAAYALFNCFMYNNSQEKFQIPISGNSCYFSQIWEKVGEKLGKHFPNVGKFWNPVQPFSSHWGIFLGKKRQ